MEKATQMNKVTSNGYIRKNVYVLHKTSNREEVVAESFVDSSGMQTAAVALKVATTSYGEESSGDRPSTAKVREARMKGFEGDACKECGNFTLVRNGTCLKCNTCGGTTGCS